MPFFFFFRCSFHLPIHHFFHCISFVFPSFSVCLRGFFVLFCLVCACCYYDCAYLYGISEKRQHTLFIIFMITNDPKKTKKKIRKMKPMKATRKSHVVYREIDSIPHNNNCNRIVLRTHTHTKSVRNNCFSVYALI